MSRHSRTRVVPWLIAILSAGVLSAQERPIALRTSMAFDGTGKALHNMIIVVEGAKIGGIGGATPPGAIVYDLSKFTVSPGWIDTHSHLSYHFDAKDRLAGPDEPASQALLSITENGVRTLNAGFTTVQSPGALIDKDLRYAIARGVLPVRESSPHSNR